MATENDWLTTNLTERLKNPYCDFKASYRIDKFEYLTFAEESENVKQSILQKYSKLFVPLSGGMDSEYVMKQLQKEAIPIIVVTPGNKEESVYAFKYCEQIDVKPVIIEKTEKEVLQTFCTDIFLKLNGVGYNSVPALIASRYAQDKNGVAIIGEHGYNDINEWDFYNDVILGKESSVYYFLHNPKILMAMRKSYNFLNMDHQSFKTEIYGLEKREKMIYKYSDKFYQIVNALIRSRVRPKVRDVIEYNV
jgi:hypothetical protein